MILVVGGLADRVTELVCARLDDCGYPYRLLDLGFYPANFEVTWHWRDSQPCGYVAGPDWRLDLDEIRGVYVRYLGAEGRTQLPTIPPAQAPAMYFEYDSGLMALLEDFPRPVVNRVAGGMSNSSKAYQALLVRQCGLRTPRTLISSDPEAVRSFYADCGGEVVLQVGQRRPLDRAASSTGAPEASALAPARSRSVPGIRPRRRRTGAHRRRRGIRHAGAL